MALTTVASIAFLVAGWAAHQLSLVVVAIIIAIPAAFLRFSYAKSIHQAHRTPPDPLSEE